MLILCNNIRRKLLLRIASKYVSSIERINESTSTVQSKHIIGKTKEKNLLSGRVHVNIGTIGHVDHGKTTLTSAITQVASKKGFGKYVTYDEIDKAPEEQSRGVTINAAHVQYCTSMRHYAHTDCPGHREYIKNMICGTSQMDGAILVVAASEGQMPQTREHLLLSKRIGVNKIVVYINKCDLIDSEVRELVEIETRELLDSFEFDGNETPFVFGSALLALNGDQSELGEPSIYRLLDSIDNHISLPERDITSPFQMSVESNVSITGRGTVCIGTVGKGVLNRGEHIEIIGFGQKIKSAASDIHVFGKSMPKCEAGDHVGILCRGIKNFVIERGMIISKPNSLSSYNRFEAALYLISKEEGGRDKPISNRYVQQIFSSTWCCGCRVDIPDDEGSILMPGDHCKVHLTINWNMYMQIGQSFTIREQGKTVASGLITNYLASIEMPSHRCLAKIDLPYGKDMSKVKNK